MLICKKISISKCHGCLRRYLSVKVKKEPKKYSSTVNLPKTKFDIWIKPTRRVELDEHIQKVCNFSELYEWQRQNVTGKEYVLHDGPPYANGVPHMGHAINKILKDITIRSKLLQGRKIHYKPGWDCHGLPIELRALTGIDSFELSAIDIRNKAQEYAIEAIGNQKAIFRSWGVMADWKSGCYYTFDKDYIMNEMEMFYKMYCSGIVYQDFKPVYWSPSSNTALAEAELEYNHEHVSKSIYIAFRLSHVPDMWLINDKNEIYALIWTTTPWTLPANQGVAFNPNIKYSLVKISGKSGAYLMATNLILSLGKTMKKEITVLKHVSELEVATLRYFHPLNNMQELPFLPADYVTLDKGTGLVHTAPAHGQDDFLLGLKNKLDVLSLVDEDGRYVKEAGFNLEGLSVLSEGNDRVLSILQKNILHTEKFVHSYPYDWRTGKPVILRASRQWFIDTSSFKEQAVKELEKVKVVPNSGTSGFLSQLERRPYWCISRQRVWGVPIPVMYSKETGKAFLTLSQMKHYKSLLVKYGPNYWWALPMDELVPDDILKELQLDLDGLVKSNDILDIWLDSGLSWSQVLDTPVADLYVEGVDQFTGWFQSSLMTSVALQGRAPYRELLVHGFAVDEEGRKMSKSIGNVVSPQDIVRGRVDLKEEPGYGVDVLRWWVAAHSLQHTNIPVSKTLLFESQQCVKKLRSVFRFILGVLHDIPQAAPSNISYFLLDQYILHLLLKFHDEADQLYNEYQYNRVCAHLINFITNEVSALYCHLTKDRLYCDAEDSNGRRAAQFTMNHILHIVCHVMAPILPILSEEVYLHLPNKVGKETLFRTSYDVCQQSWRRPDLEETFKLVLDVKQTLIKETPINASISEMSAIISASPLVFHELKKLQADEESDSSQLAEVLQTSSVVLKELKSNNTPYELKVKSASGVVCERCRRRPVESSSDLCKRCIDVLSSL